MPARLVVESGMASPRVLELHEAEVIDLGRSRKSHIVLQDYLASREHARLSHRNRTWTILDLETKNGTLVNGQLIKGETLLQHGQLIQIGPIILRFELVPEIDEDEITPDAGTPAAANRLSLDPSDSSLFQADDLTALVRFMDGLMYESMPNRLVQLALETILRQTGADQAGFLSLDNAPELRLVLPAQTAVDQHLSHRLTQQVQQHNRMVWLCSPEGRALDSDSLSNFHDAICIPLRVRGKEPGDPLEPPLGALHVYKNTRAFTERHVRFCEVLANRLANALQSTRSLRALEATSSRIRERGSAALNDKLVGSSQIMATIRHQGRLLAGSNCTVLISGESGVGKEVVALSLHNQSPRYKGPLVPLNCAAIAPSMAESELFGHVKGAFTGAVRDHQGVFAQADMGTLFLDELGELSLEIQAKLLRALETRRIRPVGAKQDVPVDVRIIAATNRDLERDVAEGRFRRDLYFRLMTSRIVVPSLKEHLADIPELVNHFLDHIKVETKRNVTLSEAALERLMSYSWPGNVRQLRSVLEGAVALAGEKTVIHASDLHLPDGLAEMLTDRPPTLNLEALEEWAIRHALEETVYNISQAAGLLGIHRETLAAKMKKFQITRPEV